MDTRVLFPEFFSVSEIRSIRSPLDITDTDNSRSRYQLAAVVVHHGSSMAGHFFTYRRVQRGWIRVSDTNVRPVPKIEVMRSQAYMLFYYR